MPSDPSPLISAEGISRRVRELAAEVSKTYAGNEIVAVGILKGAFVFMADLVRHLTVPVSCDFIRVSSYGDAKTSGGIVRFEFDVTQPLTDKHVLLIEDIVDTGLTLSYLCENFRTRKPASLRICALLHKPARTRVEVPLDFVGFTIPDKFVVGYGLDVAGKYRNLPFVGVVSEDEKT
ncbi:MAG: hypoxanthine phosphoribosyltransferase [Planctomycetota bacterium]|nr:hypoxanthine phosphoribosyltransferase [Planctomycetota bacterium]